VSGLPSDDETDDAAAEQARALVRHANSIPRFDARWLWGVLIVAPVVLSASVYFRYYPLDGRHSNAGQSIVEVRLVEQPAAENKPLVRASERSDDGRHEPLVDDPKRPIPEETRQVSAPPNAIPGPAPEQSATSPMSRPQQNSSGLTSVFQKILLSHIARYRKYPSAAKSGQHGIAQIMFSMRRDGIVDEIRLQSSTGHQILDDAAVDTIRRAQPLPIIPADLPDRLTILLPISFDPPQ
jgi:periplasmic protein TonB